MHCLYCLYRLVGKVQLVVDKCRVDGTQVRLAEVEVGDETGTVSLRARDEQIDVLNTISDERGAVVLRNCTLELYQGRHIRLAVTKWGKLTRFPDNIASTPPPPSKMNKDRNFSLIDLSLVASELASYGREQYAESEGQSVSSRPHSTAHMAGRGRGRKPMHTNPVHTIPQPIHYPTSLAYPGGLHGYGFEAIENQHYQHGQHTNNPQLIMPAYNMHQRPSHLIYRPDSVPQSLVGGHVMPKQQVGSRPDSPSQQGRMNPQAATFDPSYRRGGGLH
jgi:hypothetical protein